MEKTRRRLKWLKLAIEHWGNCPAVHLRTCLVHEHKLGTTVWLGTVEVFLLTGHPAARRCYAWVHGNPEEFVTVMELPPVRSPSSAVKLWLARRPEGDSLALTKQPCMLPELTLWSWP
jgi:hypothetical protein